MYSKFQVKDLKKEFYKCPQTLPCPEPLWLRQSNINSFFLSTRDSGKRKHKKQECGTEHIIVGTTVINLTLKIKLQTRKEVRKS